MGIKTGLTLLNPVIRKCELEGNTNIPKESRINMRGQNEQDALDVINLSRFIGKYHFLKQQENEKTMGV